MSNQEPNANPTHIKPIQPALHIRPNTTHIPTPLPIEDTLCDRRHRRIVPSLDLVETFCEVVVVFVDGGGVGDVCWGVHVVSGEY